jgi:hypothetical protein
MMVRGSTPLREQQRGGRVPQIVKPHEGQIRCLQHGFEFTMHVPRVERCVESTRAQAPRWRTIPTA